MHIHLVTVCECHIEIKGYLLTYFLIPTYARLPVCGPIPETLKFWIRGILPAEVGEPIKSV